MASSPHLTRLSCLLLSFLYSAWDATHHRRLLQEPEESDDRPGHSGRSLEVYPGAAHSVASALTRGRTRRGVATSSAAGAGEPFGGHLTRHHQQVLAAAAGSAAARTALSHLNGVGRAAMAPMPPGGACGFLFSADPAGAGAGAPHSRRVSLGGGDLMLDGACGDRAGAIEEALLSALLVDDPPGHAAHAAPAAHAGPASTSVVGAGRAVVGNGGGGGGVGGGGSAAAAAAAACELGRHALDLLSPASAAEATESPPPLCAAAATAAVTIAVSPAATTAAASAVGSAEPADFAISGAEMWLLHEAWVGLE